MSKLNSACFAMRSVKSRLSYETLRMIYSSYTHSIINYGIIFWSNITSSTKIFKIRKIRIITNSRSMDSYRDLFKKMKILPLCSQYIYTVPYIVTNKNLYKHNFNNRYNTNLHPPISNLTKFQKWAYYSGIKVFSHLPPNIKCLMNDLE